MKEPVTTVRKSRTMTLGIATQRIQDQIDKYQRGLLGSFKNVPKHHLLHFVSHLTYQQETGKAGVYDLVTKPKYFENHFGLRSCFQTIHNRLYSQRIQTAHLFTDGVCKRHNTIQLQHFLSDYFQNHSGAEFTIVAYDIKYQ